MNLEEFSEHVRGFANSELSNLALIENFAMGLSGETGEVIDLLKKFYYHNQKLDRAKLILELGDCLFYWVALLQRLGLSSDVYNIYSVCNLVIKPNPIRKRVPLRLASAAGKIAEWVDGYLFFAVDLDKPNTINPSDGYDFFLYYLESWRSLLIEFNIAPEKVMEANRDKLTARHKGTSFDAEESNRSKLVEE